MAEGNIWVETFSSPCPEKGGEVTEQKKKKKKTSKGANDCISYQNLPTLSCHSLFFHYLLQFGGKVSVTS